MNITTNILTKKDLEDVKSQILNWSVPPNTFYISESHWEDILKAETLDMWGRVYSLILNHGWKIEFKQKDPETYVLWLAEPAEALQMVKIEAFELSPKGIKRASYLPQD